MVEWIYLEGVKDMKQGLYHASRYPRIEVIEFLISKGADSLDLALCGAVESSNKEIVEYLLKNGANWDSSLMFLCEFNCIEISKMVETSSVDKLNNALKVNH